jgi:hypothetical protein
MQAELGARAARVIGPLRSGTRAAAMSGWTMAMTQFALIRVRGLSDGERIAMVQRLVKHWARVLLAVFGIDQHWVGVQAPEPRKARLVVSGEMANDAMTLHVEVEGQPEGLATRLAEAMRDVTKLRGEVALCAPGSLPNDGRVIEDARKYD